MDNDDDKILDLEFAEDDLESMGYKRPATGSLVLFDRTKQRGDQGADAGALVRPENLHEAVHPDPSRPNAAPRHEASPVRVSTSGGSSVNISIINQGVPVSPLTADARTSGALGDGDGGTESRMPRHARPTNAGSLPYMPYLIVLGLFSLAAVAAVCAFFTLQPGNRDHQHGPVPLSSMPVEEALHNTPGAFSEAHDTLKTDLVQLEELFYRARSELPPASSLRRILEDGPQPQALREQVEALGGLHDRLVGNKLESEIARSLRVSEQRLRAATAGPVREKGFRGSGWSQEVVRAELERAEHMVAEVAAIITDIDAARAHASRLCGRQPFKDSHGSWGLSDNSTCPIKENNWGLSAGFAISLGNGVSNAQVVFGFINWICGDLDALTAIDGAFQASVSIATEARRVLARWEQLVKGWTELEAAIAAK